MYPEIKKSQLNTTLNFYLFIENYREKMKVLDEQIGKTLSGHLIYPINGSKYFSEMRWSQYGRKIRKVKKVEK